MLSCKINAIINMWQQFQKSPIELLQKKKKQIDFVKYWFTMKIPVFP